MSSYLVKSSCRSLVSHVADESHHGFLVGTANLRGPNEIRLLRYFEEDEAIECSAVYAHKHEVTGLAACPFDASLVASVFNAAPRLRAAVWRLPDLPGLDSGAETPAADADSSSAAPRDMALVADVPPSGDGEGSDVHSVQWRPTRDGANAVSLLSVEASAVHLWALHEGGGSAQSLAASGRELATGEASFIGGAAWDPHHVNEVAVAADSSVHCWDLRSGQRARGIEGVVPPGSVVRDLSYNPNKPWHLATAGDDFRAKVWDLRKAARPVKILDGHTHWATRVAFNPFHDQLMLSGSSDARVVLWRVSSVSSAPLLELGDEEIDADTGKRAEAKLAPDSAIRVHDEHDDTVVALAWSAHNAWVYASLSYPGKVVVCQVPSAEKYRVLL